MNLLNSEVGVKIKIAMALALALSGPSVPAPPQPKPEPSPVVNVPEDGARDGEWTFRRDANHPKGGYWFRYVRVNYHYTATSPYSSNFNLPARMSPTTFPYRVGAVNITSSNCST